MINKTLPEIGESHSDGNSLYQNAVDVRTDRDLFRKKEKQIKSLLKRVEEDIDPKLRNKRSWGDQKTLLSDDDGEISWEDDIIDARRPNKTNRNGTGLHLKASFPKCLSCLDHECSDSACEIFQLSSHRGFYVIKGALCPSQQLFWAKTAVEKYSRAEHTNLTNLVKQKLEDESTSPREKMIAQSSLEDDLWEKSIVEGNGFHNFKKLRWSCLGYHYSKLMYNTVNFSQ
jgi:hypothetical protein